MDTQPTKRCFHGYFPFDYKALERSIDDMRAQGWRLTSLGRFFASYERGDMEGLTARVDVFTGAYGEDGAKKLEKYKNKQQAAGWEHAGELDFFHVFYGAAGLPRPQPDIQAERRLGARMVWSRELSALGLCTAFLLLGVVALFKQDYTDYLTITGLGSMAILPLFTLPALIVAVLILRPVLGARRALRRGERLPVPTPTAARRRYRLLYGALMTAGIYIFLMFFTDALLGHSRTFLLVLPLAGAGLAVWLLQKGQMTGIKRTALILVLLACGAAMFAIQGQKPQEGEGPANMETVLTLSALGADTPANVHYRSTASPLVPHHFVYVETASDGTTVKNEQFYIPREAVRERVFGEVLELLLGKMPLTKLDAAAWDADVVYTAGEGIILLRRGDEILYYEARDAHKQLLPLSPDML